MPTKSQQTYPTPAHIAREKEAQRLRLLARRLRRAATQIDLGSTLWIDGAYVSARGKLNDAEHKLRLSITYLRKNHWHVHVPKDEP